MHHSNTNIVLEQHKILIDGLECQDYGVAIQAFVDILTSDLVIIPLQSCCHSLEYVFQYTIVSYKAVAKPLEPNAPIEQSILHIDNVLRLCDKRIFILSYSNFDNKFFPFDVMLKAIMSHS